MYCIKQKIKFKLAAFQIAYMSTLKFNWVSIGMISW